MARKPAHKIKSPAPRNRAVLNTSGSATVKPVAAKPGVPGTETAPVPTPTNPAIAADTPMGNFARFSDEGAAVNQVQTTAQPDLGYDDTPLSDVDGPTPNYVYVASAPLVAVGKRL